MTTQDIQPNAKTEKESETISADTISAMNTQQEPSVVEIEEEHEKKVKKEDANNLVTGIYYM